MRALRLTAVAVLVGALLPVSTPAEARVPKCAGQKATIVGTNGDDRLAGTNGRDVVVARGGDDVVRGFGGDDLLCGNAGADVLEGGRGADALYGGDDRLGDDVGGRSSWATCSAAPVATTCSSVAGTTGGPRPGVVRTCSRGPMRGAG